MSLKYKIFFLCIGFMLNRVVAQEVEQSLFTLQTGALGIWATHELRLHHHWVLRSELGIDGGVITKEIHGGTFPVFLPLISVSPRYYYNLPKRQASSKDVYHNSGNFFSLPIRWYPNWFSISNTENNRVGDDIMVLPTWGIKRNISWKFNYELGAGFGVSIPASTKQAGAILRPAYNVLLRIGYKFY